MGGPGWPQPPPERVATQMSASRLGFAPGVMGRVEQKYIFWPSRVMKWSTSALGLEKETGVGRDHTESSIVIFMIEDPPGLLWVK